MNLLEELRLQRELIRKHLAWLDQKIDTLENKKPEVTTQELATDSNIPDFPADTVEAPHESEMPGQPQEEEDEAELYTYKSDTGNEIRRAKIGCLLLATLGSLLFLFLLFGLPYLLD